MKKSRRKLVLGRETIRTLAPETLGLVAGGQADDSEQDVCTSIVTRKANVLKG
ncbi:MAG TPA: class I lanthipeptide [Kofleriaceae bacterium]|jgi:hypothetical protein|nr:class I lanthipeptide [Kofleriaceae bacterium]